MTCLHEDLHGAVIARWYATVHGAAGAERDAGQGTVRRAPWATREKYYRALLSCLADEPGVDSARRLEGSHELRTALTAAAGVRSSSVLYSLAGSKVPTSMLAQVPGALAEISGPGRDIGYRLAAETKVWSHWPYRAGWLAELRVAGSQNRPLAAATLIRVLAAWAHDNRPLAAFNLCEPPLSAAEDLLIISAGKARAPDVMAVLREVIRLGCGPWGAAPGEVLEAVTDRLMAIAPGGGDVADELAGQLAELLSELRLLLPQLTSQQLGRLRDEFAFELADMAETLGEVNGRLSAADPARGRIDGPAADHPADRRGGWRRRAAGSPARDGGRLARRPARHRPAHRQFS